MTLSEQQYISQVLSLVADLSDEEIPVENLTLDHNLWQTMSFRLVDFYSLIEERFDLTIPNEEIDKWETIRDVAQFLLPRVNDKEGRVEKTLTYSKGH